MPTTVHDLLFCAQLNTINELGNRNAVVLSEINNDQGQKKN